MDRHLFGGFRQRLCEPQLTLPLPARGRRRRAQKNLHNLLAAKPGRDGERREVLAIHAPRVGVGGKKRPDDQRLVVGARNVKCRVALKIVGVDVDVPGEERVHDVNATARARVRKDRREALWNHGASAQEKFRNLAVLAVHGKKQRRAQLLAYPERAVVADAREIDVGADAEECLHALLAVCLDRTKELQVENLLPGHCKRRTGPVGAAPVERAKHSVWNQVVGVGDGGAPAKPVHAPSDRVLQVVRHRPQSRRRAQVEAARRGLNATGASKRPSRARSQSRV